MGIRRPIYSKEQTSQAERGLAVTIDEGLLRIPMGGEAYILVAGNAEAGEPPDVRMANQPASLREILRIDGGTLGHLSGSPLDVVDKYSHAFVRLVFGGRGYNPAEVLEVRYGQPRWAWASHEREGVTEVYVLLGLRQNDAVSFLPDDIHPRGVIALVDDDLIQLSEEAWAARAFETGVTVS